MDTVLDNPDMEIFTDRTSFVWDGKHKAGSANRSEISPPGSECSASRTCGSYPSSRV